ncbi:hypothetical protein FRB99_006584 [Tulasnella sp. 403]|nr:hypothetical protein FRB99_006584 [Tulasnella sp. 403]
MDDGAFTKSSSGLEMKAEVWVTVQHSKKSKKDERNSRTASQNYSGDDSPRRLRERSSWLSLPRLSSSSPNLQGYWNPVIIHLFDEPSSCDLRITCAETSKLLHCVAIHTLNQTDVRPAHPSLFSRGNVLGIHCKPGQAYGLPNQRLGSFDDSSQSSFSFPNSPFSSTSSPVPRTPLSDFASGPAYAPLYLAFPSEDLYNAWLLLLRSFAQPEAYGRDALPDPLVRDIGGLYRAWRGIELGVLEGRALLSGSGTGTNPAMTSLPKGPDADVSGSKEASLPSSEYDLYCEIHIDSLLSGRTTTKRVAAPHPSSTEPAVLWHESFLWPDMPFSNTLVIAIWKTKVEKDKSFQSQSGSGQGGGARFKSSVSSSISGGVALISNAGSTSKKEREPSLIGTVSVALSTFRRGEWVEGWWAVTPSTTANFNVVGWGTGASQLKLKLKFDEVFILPSSEYMNLAAFLDSPDGTELFSLPGASAAFGPNRATQHPSVHANTIATHVNHLRLASSTLVSSLVDALHNEIASFAEHLRLNPSASPNTLFRGNTHLTKTMEFAMNRYGKIWLDRSLGSHIRKLLAERVSLETDPVMIDKKHTKDEDVVQKEVETNVQLLVEWCEKLWGSIWNARDDCPTELRVLFHQVRTVVDRYFTPPSSKHAHAKTKAKMRRDYSTFSDADSDSEGSEEGGRKDGGSKSTYQTDLKWQAVSAFVFLRFFVPAILHPHLSGLVSGAPPLSVQKTLKAVAKVLQSLANLSSNVNLDDHMAAVKVFVESQRPGMIDYLLRVSTRTPEAPVGPSTATSSSRRVIRYLEGRWPSLSSIHRDSLPALPHLVDPSRHLSMMASAVVRNTTEQRASDGVRQEYQFGDPLSTSPPLEEFHALCFKVETEILSCVEQAKVKITPNERPRSRSYSKPRRASSGILRPEPVSVFPIDTYGESHSRAMSSGAIFTMAPNIPSRDVWPATTSPKDMGPISPTSEWTSMSPTLSSAPHGLSTDTSTSKTSSGMVFYQHAGGSSSGGSIDFAMGFETAVERGTIGSTAERRSRPSTAPSLNDSSTDSYGRRLRSMPSFVRPALPKDRSSLARKELPASPPNADFDRLAISPVSSEILSSEGHTGSSVLQRTPSSPPIQIAGANKGEEQPVKGKKALKKMLRKPW